MRNIAKGEKILNTVMASASMLVDHSLKTGAHYNDGDGPLQRKIGKRPSGIPEHVAAEMPQVSFY